MNALPQTDGPILPAFVPSPILIQIFVGAEDAEVARVLDIVERAAGVSEKVLFATPPTRKVDFLLRNELSEARVADLLRVDGLHREIWRTWAAAKAMPGTVGRVHRQFDAESAEEAVIAASRLPIERKARIDWCRKRWYALAPEIKRILTDIRKDLADSLIEQLGVLIQKDRQEWEGLTCRLPSEWTPSPLVSSVAFHAIKLMRPVDHLSHRLAPISYIEEYVKLPEPESPDSPGLDGGLGDTDFPLSDLDEDVELPELDPPDSPGMDDGLGDPEA